MLTFVVERDVPLPVSFSYRAELETALSEVFEEIRPGDSFLVERKFQARLAIRLAKKRGIRLRAAQLRVIWLFSAPVERV